MEEPNINYKRLYELSIIEKNNLLILIFDIFVIHIYNKTW